MGPSGSGKTSLLKAAVGLVPLAEGSIRILGQAPGSRAVRGRVGYIPQQLGLVRSRTALLNALMGALQRTATLPSLLGDFAPADREAARAALESVGLGEKAEERACRD